MFNGFTKEASDFLWELSFHNERPWFQAHKEQFERCVNEPFKALARDTLDQTQLRLADRTWNVHISRIYRDARRLFGRGPYKDHLWFTIQEGDHHQEQPVFWFELGASYYSYGLGMYSDRPALMEQFRKAIDANPARFERLAKDTLSHKGFRLSGLEYKRPKGDRGEILNPWYNRRYLSVGFEGDFGGDLLKPELPALLAEAFVRLLPLYTFFTEVYRANAEARKQEGSHV